MLLVFFDDFIIGDINSTIVTIGTSHAITKIVLEKSVKKQIIDFININCSDYRLKNLMNPYLRFEDTM